jgi:GNAT superfamily N-acetyltransferase
VTPPYYKDYDTIEPDAGPVYWPYHFDLANWGIWLARRGNRLVGGAAVAFQTAGVDMLEGRADLAVLWDLRVDPPARGSGIGKKLLARACQWSRERGARQLKIETQNINVAACRFYASQGCQLGQIHCHAYAAVPGCAEEVMLCWYRNLE